MKMTTSNDKQNNDDAKKIENAKRRKKVSCAKKPK